MMIGLRAVRDSEPISPGRWPAPPLVTQDRHRQTLARPYPVRRRRYQLVAVGITVLAALTADALGVADPLVLGVILLVGLLGGLTAAAWLTPTPHPTFLTHGHYRADRLQAGHWIRLPDDTAVQAVHVTLRGPDTLGDPTPPVIVVRGSDDGVYTYRPTTPWPSSSPSTSADPPNPSTPPVKARLDAQQSERDPLIVLYGATKSRPGPTSTPVIRSRQGALPSPLLRIIRSLHPDGFW